jgi:murein DD-endopeptidase MepM/ murein hydrolase activator NlpD
VSPQTPARDSRRTFIADLEPEDRRGWLSHGLAALAISALGLAVAGSVAVTTNAQTAAGPVTETTIRQSVGKISTSPRNVPNPKTPAPSVLEQGTLSAFENRQATTEGTSRSTLRSAQVKELAAARAEDLSKTAENITRAARSENSKVRTQDLKASERAVQANAVRIAEEARQRAAAARLAAENARMAAEVAASTTATTPAGPPPTIDLSTIPAGSGGSSPVPGAVIGAHFGQYGLWSRYHTGLDFRAAYGVPIRAVRAGVVLYAGNSGDWAGNHIAVRHADGMTTMSSHMSRMSVAAGQTVQAGQVIGYVGQTGRAFGAHLHFELYPAGVKYGDVYRAVNPQPWLVANGVQTR